MSESTFEAAVISENGKILDVNTNFNQMFSYERHEVIGMNAIEFVTPKYRDFVQQQILSQNEGAYESMLLRKDGTSFVG